MEINIRFIFAAENVHGSSSRFNTINRGKYRIQYNVRVYDSHYKQDWLLYGEAGYLYGYTSYLRRTRYVLDKLRTFNAMNLIKITSASYIYVCM